MVGAAIMRVVPPHPRGSHMPIRYRDRSSQPRTGNLFDILAALSTDAVAAFPALRPHQRQA